MTEAPKEESTIKSDIIEIPEEVLNNYRNVRGTEFAEVIDIGPDAFSDKLDASTPWCKVGDTVAVVRFAGAAIQVENARYRMIQDEDIVAVIEDAKDE